MKATLADWRAQVEADLGSVAFDKALVHTTAEGIALQPLYTERPAGEAAYVRGAAAGPFQVCMRVERGGDVGAQLDGGADAVWLDSDDLPGRQAAWKRGAFVVDEPRHDRTPASMDEVMAEPAGEMWTSADWIAEVARGRLPTSILDARSPLPPMVADALKHDALWRSLRIGGLPFHDAGADAADEIALMLASLASTLRTLDESSIDISRVGPLLWAQVAVGRDTFGELCKLRALRVVWHKVLAAAGVKHTALDAMHAVCSSRSQAQRDPWVNMLRGTTQVFAAALGGAQLVTPLPFDAALGVQSAHGNRVARNTALVLREESHLGRVLDAAGGSYYLETRTDALARAAWSRFQTIERDGGIVKLLATGGLRQRLEDSWAEREAALAKRKEPVLGVSEFANLDEKLPAPPPPLAPVPAAPALLAHRDAEAFEALRTRGEAVAKEVALVVLGPPAEHRARAGYAAALFSIAGLRTREAAGASAVDIACICGSDERYAAEAVATAQALRAADCRRIVLAGRPGALEAELRAAGVDTFIFVGCDALATLTDLVGGIK